MFVILTFLRFCPFNSAESKSQLVISGEVVMKNNLAKSVFIPQMLTQLLHDY